MVSSCGRGFEPHIGRYRPAVIESDSSHGPVSSVGRAQDSYNIFGLLECEVNRNMWTSWLIEAPTVVHGYKAAFFLFFWRRQR
eukprot:364474-Chlamydomonas_euryale.AAC.7